MGHTERMSSTLQLAYDFLNTWAEEPDRNMSLRDWFDWNTTMLEIGEDLARRVVEDADETWEKSL